MEKEKKLLIIDGHSLLYRAFHALPPLSNSKGQLTNAVYGFLLILFKAIKDVEANYVVACFDTRKPTFRHEQFEEYKAHRAPMPEGISSQIPIMKEVLVALNVPMFEKEGFEADDLVATIATKNQEKVKVFILSGDLDNLQLVNNNIKLYTMGKGIKESVIYAKKILLQCIKPMYNFQFIAMNVGGVINGIHLIMELNMILMFHFLNNLMNCKKWFLDHHHTLQKM